MADIKIHTEDSSAKTVLAEAVEAEKNRIAYALQLGAKKINFFESKYKVSSREFFRDGTAENLEGKDIEYVEWAGEAKLHSRLQERLAILKGIEYVD
ncbi:MAG: hypothetical protein L3J49_11425 [Desulfobulbaceae bacterium]|nr:hypothetical protein [Desulfobulbaceae bacterium]